MYKEVWMEYVNPAGISYMTKRVVRSRRKTRRRRIDLALWLDRAVTAAMYIWAVVLLIATAAVLIDIWG